MLILKTIRFNLVTLLQCQRLMSDALPNILLISRLSLSNLLLMKRWLKWKRELALLLNIWKIYPILN